jgi:hypothetical protein
LGISLVIVLESKGVLNSIKVHVPKKREFGGGDALYRPGIEKPTVPHLVKVRKDA